MLKPWRVLEKVFPIIQWSRGYNADAALGDLVAGITVGLTLIPQSIAYASLAGLDPQYGLYSSLCGGFIYAVFGTIAELNIAPTALLSLLTYTYTQHVSFGNINAAILLCFLAGIIELLCGLLHLGFLVDFVSTPVVAGFTSAGAITIASSQVKNLFGLKFEAETFTQVWSNVFKHITELKKWDTILGFACCAVLLTMRKLKDCGAPPSESGNKHLEKPSTLKKLIWFASVSRNAIVVVTCAFIAFFFQKHDEELFSLTSKVPSGWPNVTLPTFKVAQNNKTMYLTDMIEELGVGVFVIPFIAIIANVGIAKAFAHGKVVEASQEMIAVGLCNIIGSFFGSYPVNASFSRAAVGGASGIRTPLSGIYTGLMVFLAFTLLTPYFSYIPKPTLSAVIICAVIFMVEVMITKIIWKINKMDLIPFFLTLISCLLIGLELGILMGVLVDVIKLLYYTARPKVIVEKTCYGKQYLKITLTSSLMFVSAEYVREKIFRRSIEHPHEQFILIDCNRVRLLDFTAGKCIGALVSDLQKANKQVSFVDASETVEKVVRLVCHPNISIYDTEIDFQKSLIGKYGALGRNDSELTVSTQL